VKNELIQRFGEERVVDLPVQDGELPLLMLDLEAKIPVNVLLTNGLSKYKMPVHEKEKGKEFNELCFCLPGYWDWEDRSNPNTNWVFHWIQRLAKYVQENETWFGHGHTMPCGKEMQSLSLTMKQNHFILVNPMLLEKEMAPVKSNGKEINFLFIVPIFGDEMDYKQGKGTQKLLAKFINKGITEELDDFRGNALKRRWIFRS
jgi:hypothetical protein